jgi:uncharacterized repeat protein (TIGR01451 family)
MRLIYLAVFLVIIISAQAKDSDENKVAFSDFTLNIGDAIYIGDYRAELIEIQSVKDGLAVMHISQVNGALDEQRALLQNTANNFDGGADGGGITLTVIDIFDDSSAKVRVEYPESMGTARKRSAETPSTPRDVPDLFVQKTFEKDRLSVGDDVKVTIAIKNMGTGQASDITIEDLPPLPEFSYVAGYPPRIKDRLDPGESDSSMYVMNAVKEGSIRVPAILVRYTDSKKNAKSNNSEPFNVIIDPRSKADLEMKLLSSGPIPSGKTGTLNVSLTNTGKASATRIEILSEIKPSEGLTATGLEKSYFEILPGKEETYAAQLRGDKAGNYTIMLKASFQGGDGAAIQEGKAEVVVLEREYKYLYLLFIIPILIIVAWTYKRYREYKY